MRIKIVISDRVADTIVRKFKSPSFRDAIIIHNGWPNQLWRWLYAITGELDPMRIAVLNCDDPWYQVIASLMRTRGTFIAISAWSRRHLSPRGIRRFRPYDENTIPRKRIVVRLWAFITAVTLAMKSPPIEPRSRLHRRCYHPDSSNASLPFNRRSMHLPLSIIVCPFNPSSMFTIEACACRFNRGIRMPIRFKIRPQPSISYWTH